ncbi:sigma-70 family RNA polymerase sigma factor [Herbiconiux ginsengi]|uniref:RNA polymerase sigma factor, sigma-70 family n=1 Tax=Herbiconiux ginsengi TaxID=381665 RepID=A0A1H3KZB9_9MICO|nr:sigma-70 family RNA polymerase sigma factor [Herbiconiux ginsengi]SDY57430.1 RNA polymerase sigma factor, sigma-70 family [Herbiconiux ginsengi]
MRDHDTASDQELIDATRNGDRAAFAVLWSRHSGAALTVARSFTSLDADDVVAEAFSRIYATIRNGAGPTAGFRPYLFTTVRNVAAKWGRRAATVNLDDIETLESPSTTESEMLEALDRTTTAHAFKSLPTRWQEVLWYTEVEGLPPRQVGLLLGMKPNSISALAIRAREGLRQAWIKEHLASTGTEPECTRTIERLPAYARGTLGSRPTQQVQDHLAGCTRCQIVAEEATDISSRLALILLPLAAGVAGATAYAASLHPAGAVAAGSAAATVPLSATMVSTSSTPGASSGGGLGAGTTLTAGLIGAGALVLAGVGVSVALLLGPAAMPPGAPQAGTGASDGSAQPDAPIDAPSTTAPEPRPSTAPTPVPPPTSEPEPSPEPTTPALPPPGQNQPARPAATPSPTATPTPTPTPTPEPLPAPSIAAPAGPTEVFPELAGTAQAHAVITITRVPVHDEPGVVDGEASTWTTVANSSGLWTATLTGIRPGSSEIVATQTNPDGILSTTTERIRVFLEPAPSARIAEVIPHFLYTITVDGQRGKVFRFEHGPWSSEPLPLDATGRWEAESPVLLQNPAGLIVRYVNGDKIGAPAPVMQPTGP